MGDRGNIVMPLEAFDALEAILQSPDADTDRSFAAFGHKWGQRLVEMLDERCTLEELEQFVIQIAWEAGISKLDVKKTYEGISIRVKESGINNNSFIGGFLTGVISELLSTDEEQKQYGFELAGDAKEQTFIIRETLYSQGSKTIDESPVKYPSLVPGERYLVIEEDATEPVKAFDILKDLTEHGYLGLCMTTILPTRAMENYGLHGTNFIWLTDYRTGAQEFKEMGPMRLEFEMSRDVRKFLSDQRHRVLVIHGIEYLIRHNGFDKISNFLDTVSRIVSANDNLLICPIYPKALKEIDYSNMKTIFKMIGD